jgi:CHAD domain-containing protein
VLPGLIVKPWRKLVYGGGAAPGAGGLALDNPDDEWHAVRIRGKRVRYAASSIADVVGAGPGLLASALKRVQTILGEHQDAAVAADTWLAIAKLDPDDHALAVTAGRLYERERAAMVRARSRFAKAWKAATEKRVTQWLSR